MIFWAKTIKKKDSFIKNHSPPGGGNSEKYTPLKVA